MPVTTFDRDYLNRVLGIKVDDKTLELQVSKMGFEVEKFEKESIQLNITPNRPDLLDAVGFARSLKNFMHKGNKFNYNIEDMKPVLRINVGSKIRAVRPYVAGLVALGAELDNEAVANLMNFSEKFCDTYGRRRNKIAIGMHNLNAITPPLYYDLYPNDSFTPLNQQKEYPFEKVLKELDQGVEYGHIIDNGSQGYPALMDMKGTIALIPIINSERTKIDKETKDIFVDVTGTSEYTVGRTAEMFAATFMDLGCDVKRVEIAYFKRKPILTPMMEKKFIKMPLQKAGSQLGVALGFNNVISLANKMGYEAALLGSNIRFTLPTYRIDIMNEQDVIEDLGIAYGYDYIQPTEVYSVEQGRQADTTLAADKISQMMIGLNFSEAMNSYLTNEKINFTGMRLKPTIRVQIKNPKTTSITMMRTWLLPSLMNNLAASVHDKMPQNLFELDNVFYMHGSKPIEVAHIGLVSADSRANFNEMKAVFEEMDALLGLGYKLAPYDHKSFIDGRCAQMLDGKKVVGFFGEIHPEVLSNFGIEEPVVALEMTL
ncbi:MAG: phenylalanine--tRNA ligase subunit beta [Candidatus Micrarchaeota archaeon]|nr:phenylalanine--tRNA ligase subunit beta [Candidatus Micrarchaeota archaeon]